MEHPYLILLADDHIPFRREVRKLLEEIPGVEVTGEAGNRHELFELLEQLPPELVILDISMPDLRAGEGTQLIKSQYPDIKVLIMVMDPEKEYLSSGLVAGAAGVLPKQYMAGQLFQAIGAIRQGQIYLPPQAPEEVGPRTAALPAAGPGSVGWNNC